MDTLVNIMAYKYTIFNIDKVVSNSRVPFSWWTLKKNIIFPPEENDVGTFSSSLADWNLAHITDKILTSWLFSFLCQIIHSFDSSPSKYVIIRTTLGHYAWHWSFWKPHSRLHNGRNMKVYMKTNYSGYHSMKTFLRLLKCQYGKHSYNILCPSKRQKGHLTILKLLLTAMVSWEPSSIPPQMRKHKKLCNWGEK